jgi:sulfur-carrier protein
MVSTVMIRVRLPYHLRTLARSGNEVKIEVDEPITLRSALDALEGKFPMLRGTIRDHVTQQRRAYLRFFAAGQDMSHDTPDSPLPDRVVRGEEPLIVLGAIAGG